MILSVQSDWCKNGHFSGKTKQLEKHVSTISNLQIRIIENYMSEKWNSQMINPRQSRLRIQDIVNTKYLVQKYGYFRRTTKKYKEKNR